MSTTSPATSIAETTNRVLLSLLLWTVAALTAASLGVMDAPPPPLLPAMIWGAALTVAVVFWRSPRLRGWLRAVDARWLVAFHLVRIGYGAAFLSMTARGEIPEVLGLRAGYGDIAAGALVLVGVWAAPMRTRLQRVALFGFNLFGLLDILMVFATAQYVLFFGGGFEAMSGFSSFPFNILPTLVVPLVLTTHAAIFVKLWWARGGRPPVNP